MLEALRRKASSLNEYSGVTLPKATIRHILKTHSALNLLIFRISDHVLFKELYGDELGSNLESLVKSGLAEAFGEFGQQEAQQAEVLSLGSGEFLVLWPNTSERDYRLADAAFTLKLKVQQALKRDLLRLTGREPQLHVGCATYARRSGNSPESDFLTAMHEGRMLARRGLDLDTLRLSREFKSIIQTRHIQTLYQPIVHFPSGGILAWEALSRGPRNSPMESPAMLFDLAEEMGMLFALERVCRENAIIRAGELMGGQKLFLNIHPRTLTDPDFTPGSTKEVLERIGLRPEEIVLEITERHSIRDFSLFYKTLAHYRGQGFKVAIDDAGTGYSGLSSIAEIKPDFIKIDMSLIRSIDRDPVRRALLETLVSFSEKIGSEVIAEGIETREEAAALIEIGAHYGQGYYLGRPTYPKQLACVDLSGIMPDTQAMNVRSVGYSMPVGELARPMETVAPDTLVSQVRELFSQDQPLNSVAVVDDGAPVGLIMEYHLNRQLSAQYGVALYFKRPVSTVMDAEPLVVDESTPVEETAQQAMNRSRLQAYDDVLITRKGKILGCASVQDLLNALAKLQVELAKGTNPLTGLPGNVALENEIETRLANDHNFALIYADLDNFKAYNDYYGFKNGDRIILLLARILSWAVRRHGVRTDFVAHIGGDDMACVVSRDGAERICRAVTRCFKRLVRSCYGEEDRERGWIRTKGRDGVERDFPLVSVSLAVLSCEGKTTLHEIGERAAQMKHFAKTLAGNVYVLDRRQALGADSSCECVSSPMSPDGHFHNPDEPLRSLERSRKIT